MAAQVAAYEESMLALKRKVIPMGGFWWQLMDGGGTKLYVNSSKFLTHFEIAVHRITKLWCFTLVKFH
jgi:hypothetical protein